MTHQQNSSIKSKNKVFALVTITAIFSLCYAILRYNIFGSIPWKDLPFFIMNKAISLTAIILFAISNSLTFQDKNVKISQEWLDICKSIGITSFFLIITHVLMSFLLFKPEIFPNFFEEDGMISLIGGLSMTAGIISFVLLWGINLNARANKEINVLLNSVPTVLNVAIVFVAIHLFFMGYQGWLTPSKWQGGLPPISLISFVFSVTGLLFKNFIR